MQRKLFYRRWLLLLLALTLVFSVYFFNEKPPEIWKGTAASVEAENLQADSVNAAQKSGKSEELVYPCGFQIGIYLETNGVMVIGTDEVEGMDGVNYSPALNKVKAGDYITKMNDIDVSSKNQLMFLVNKYGAEDIILTVMRNSHTIEVKISPVQTGEQEYKMGIWIRDDTQGIGTMTYLTEEGVYGALGHGISDIDTGELLDSEGGILYQANVWGIKKGNEGNPGALYGMITYEENQVLGSIFRNSAVGVYGALKTEEAVQGLISQYELEAMPAAKRGDVETGTAYIRSYISGKSCDYEVKIEKINTSSSKTKGIVLKVTDERLLELTNGIVQGMSGSPLIQNGKLIGAVTHVFVNDPARGYGIFIEEMLGN